MELEVELLAKQKKSHSAQMFVDRLGMENNIVQPVQNKRTETNRNVNGDGRL